MMSYKSIVPNGTIILHKDTLITLRRIPYYTKMHCVTLRMMHSSFLQDRNGGKSKEEETWICESKRMFSHCWHTLPLRCTSAISCEKLSIQYIIKVSNRDLLWNYKNLFWPRRIPQTDIALIYQIYLSTEVKELEEFYEFQRLQNENQWE